MSAGVISATINDTAMAQSAKKRLPMIDIAKGIGILLIVLGHNGMFNIHLPFLADLFASFRIPFFFFMSGVTFSLGDKNIRRIVIERADAWLKPCLIVVLTLGVLYVAVGRRDIESMFVSLVYASGFTFSWPPLWFLPHLWLVYVSATALLIWGARLFDVPWRRVVSLTFLAIGGYYLLQHFSSPLENPRCEEQSTFSPTLFECGLPYSADLLLITLFFFLMGHFLSSRIKSFKPHPLLGLLALGMLITLGMLFPQRMDLNHRLYENILLTPLQAFFGIFFMLCVCAYMALSAPIARVFAYFGRVSLFILIFHSPIVFYITRGLPRFVDSALIVGIAAFVIPIVFSLVLYYLCQSNRWLRLLMFPVKQSRSLPARTSAKA